MSAEQNKMIVRRFFDEVWNERNFDATDEIFAPNCLTHQLQSGTEAVALTRSIETIKRHVGEWLEGFPDLRFTVEEMLAENDRVVTRATMRGTHAGDWRGIPATGKRVSIRMSVTHQILNQKIVADWVLVESLGFFQQLGLLPATMGILTGGNRRK